MDSKIYEIRPYGGEPWTDPGIQPRENRAIKPVDKVAEGHPERIKKERSDPTGKEPAPFKGDDKHSLVANLRDFLANLNLDLRFEIDDQTGELVTKVVNLETREVVRQIPPEVLLNLHQALKELRGVLFQSQA
jgi:flagellar protein FlaG